MNPWNKEIVECYTFWSFTPINLVIQFSYRSKVSIFRVLTSPKSKAKGFVKLFTIFTPLIRVISLEGTIIWESSSSPSLQTSPSSHYIRNDSYFSPRFSVELGPRTRVSRIKQSQMTFSDSLSKKMWRRNIQSVANLALP